MSRSAAVRLTLLLSAAAASVALLVVAGCGGGSSSSNGVARLPSASTTPSSTDSATKQPTKKDLQAAVLAYTACLREHGIKVADPTFSNSGQGGRGFFTQQLNVNRRSAKFRKAE